MRRLRGHSCYSIRFVALMTVASCCLSACDRVINQEDIGQTRGFADQETTTTRLLPGSFCDADSSDFDDDGICDAWDADDDSDGVPDIIDDLPLNPFENLDSDGDGLGNTSDQDDDNDGIPDIDERQAGTDPLNPDSDGDGVSDLRDIFPLNPYEAYDLDDDGVGDHADLDDDGDGYSDTDESICGSDPYFYWQTPVDLDRDGLCDNGVDDDDDDDLVRDDNDAFPLDPDEWSDVDVDGIGDNADPDNDNDLFYDLDEQRCETDPLDPYDTPAAARFVTTEEIHDGNGDGSSVSVIKHQHDDRGWLVGSSHYDSDGDLSQQHYWFYDNAKRVTQYTSMRHSGYWVTELWDYDTEGHTLDHKIDYRDDGLVDEIESWRYDYAGQVTYHAQFESPDLTTDFVERWTYHSDGQRLTYHFYYNESDKAHETMMWQYDARGNMTRRIGDWNGDNIFRINVWEYNSFDKPTSSATFYSEGAAESKNHIFYQDTETSAYFYDANQRLIEQWIDRNEESRETHRWQYDSFGNIVTHTVRRGANTTNALAEYWTFDGNQRLVIYERDAIYAYGWPSYQTWQYDDQGRLTRYTEDSNDTSTPIWVEQWQYDEQGTTIRYETVDSYDPAATETEVWTYNSSGDPLNYEHSINGERYSAKRWTYDQQGRPLNYEAYGSTTFGLVGESKWIYDALGNLVRWEKVRWSFGNTPHHSISYYKYRGIPNCP